MIAILKQRVTLFVLSLLAFVLTPYQLSAEENFLVKKTNYIEHIKSAKVLDDAMFDLYKLPTDFLAERPLHIPLIFHWSEPVFRFTVNEKNKISVSRVSSKYMAQVALQEYADKLSIQMEEFSPNFSDYPIKPDIHIITNQNSQSYGFFVSNTLIHAYGIVVNNRDALPDYGKWLASSPNGKKWSGFIQTNQKMARSEALLEELMNDPNSQTNRASPFDQDIIQTIYKESQNEMILGVRIQTDGQPGLFSGGYLVNGKKSGLWCSMNSTGCLLLEYYIEGKPVGARLTTHVQNPKSYRLTHIDHVENQHSSNTKNSKLPDDVTTWNTSFGFINLSMRNGNIYSLGGLERQGTTVMWITWDETGQPDAYIQPESVDPVCGLFNLFGNVSDGEFIYLFADWGIRFRKQQGLE